MSLFIKRAPVTNLAFRLQWEASLTLRLMPYSRNQLSFISKPKYTKTIINKSRTASLATLTLHWPPTSIRLNKILIRAVSRPNNCSNQSKWLIKLPPTPGFSKLPRTIYKTKWCMWSQHWVWCATRSKWGQPNLRPKYLKLSSRNYHSTNVNKNWDWVNFSMLPKSNRSQSQLRRCNLIASTRLLNAQFLHLRFLSPRNSLAQPCH